MDWLAFIGTIATAIIAGIFAIYQFRQSTTAQRALEREKLVTARKEAELAQIRSSNIEYLQAQVLPFLEKLDKALNESYKTAYFPPYFPDIGGYVPQLRRYGDRALHEWYLATEEMSRHRMRLLLVLNQDRVETVTLLLTQFIDLMKQVSEIRNQVWFKQASQLNLWEIQRSYIRVGYRLMIEIRDAVSQMPSEQGQVDDATKDALAEALTIPFEKASAVSIPYGSIQDFCWIAIWEIETSPAWHSFVESISHTTHDEFMESLQEISAEFHKQGRFLDVQLIKVNYDQYEIFCLAITFSSATRLKNFLETELETIRQAHSVLWSSFRSPVEIVIGTDKVDNSCKQSSDDTKTSK